MSATIVPSISGVLSTAGGTNGVATVLATGKIYPGMVGFLSDGSANNDQVVVLSNTGYDLRLRKLTLMPYTGALTPSNLSADDLSVYPANSTVSFPTQLVDSNVKSGVDLVTSVTTKALASVDMGQATQTSRAVSTQNNTYVSIQINFDTTAFGTITIAGGSGAITATINSVLITGITWATSDTATAAALAAAINAKSTLTAQVVASSVAGVVTVLSRALNTGGLAYTLAASGTGVTVSGATFSAGTLPVGTFDIQASMDVLGQIGGTANWASVTVSPAPVAAGAADRILVNLGQIPYPFVRVVYTRTSGNGLVDCWISVR